jgi:hypothetical protein
MPHECLGEGNEERIPMVDLQNEVYDVQIGSKTAECSGGKSFRRDPTTEGSAGCFITRCPTLYALLKPANMLKVFSNSSSVKSPSPAVAVVALVNSRSGSGPSPSPASSMSALDGVRSDSWMTRDAARESRCSGVTVAPVKNE